MRNIMPVIKQLMACYPHAEATEQTIAMYVRLLADIPVEELQGL